MEYSWDFTVLLPYTQAFLRGTLLTFSMAATSFVIGTIVGVGLGGVLKKAPCSGMLLVCNDAVRAVPLLVLLFFVYYFPYADVLGIRPPGAVACAIIAMSISQAVFTADLVRAAIDGVSQKTLSGGRSLGLEERTIWFHLVLPDVIRQILPALMAFFIGLVKLSSIASIIGCEEVVFVARVAVSQNYRSLEAWIVVAAIYVVLVLPLTILARRIERTRWLKRRS